MRFELEYEHVLLVDNLKVNENITLGLQYKLNRFALQKLFACNPQILCVPFEQLLIKKW